MKKQKYEPSHFMQVLQKGYMAIEKHGIIQKAIVLVGPSKVGKTTILHMLAKSNLKGDYNNAKTIVYKAEQPPQALALAEIGGLQAVSQTKIPNIIQLQIGQPKQKVYVVDLPGFMDSGGCFETISNRYYIQSVFQKLKGIKFVIATTFIDIKGTKDRFQLSIKEFFAFFNSSRQTINSIIDSICLYVTCVPPENCQTKLIAQMLQQGDFGKLNSTQRELYNSMLSKMKTNNRIFIFQQAVLGQTLKVNVDVAAKVNKSMSTWWQRKESEGKVEMSKINLCLLEINDREILSEFESSLNNFCEYIAKILKQGIRKQFYKEIICQFIKSVIFEKKLTIMDRVENRPQKNLWQLMNSKAQFEELRNKKMTSEDSLNSDANLLCNGVNKTFVYKRAILRLNKILKSNAKFQQQLSNQKFIQDMRITMKIMMSIISTPLSLKQKFMNYVFDLYSKLQILQSINSVIYFTVQKNKESKLTKSIQQFHESFNIHLKSIFLVDQQDENPVFKNILNSLKSISEQDFNSNNTKELQFIKNFMQEALSELFKLDEQMLEEQEISNKQLNDFKKAIVIKIQFVQFKMLENKLYQVNWENIKQGFAQSKKILQRMEGCRQAVLINTDQDSQHQIQLVQIKFLQAIAEYVKKKNPILALPIYSKLEDASEVLEIRQQIQKSRLTNWRTLSLQQKEKICDQIYKNAEKAYIYGRKQLSMSKSQLLYSLVQKMGSEEYIRKASSWLHFLRSGAESEGQTTRSGSNRKLEQSRKLEESRKLEQSRKLKSSLREIEQAKQFHEIRTQVGLFDSDIENETVLKIISMLDQKVDFADLEKFS